MRAPTAEECGDNAKVTIDGSEYTAAWYPQMGGYVGKCWLSLHEADREVDDCFGVIIWHDGEFPFDDDKQPARLHHCAPSQFIKFGELVLRLQSQAPSTDGGNFKP